MLDWTDRHCRFLLRLISRHVLLYSEMVTTAAIIHGDRPRLLDFDPSEHPLALQLGGSDPVALVECARIATDWGYDEINLNVGCPSDRVQKGRFGACLMKEPELVAECVAAMAATVEVPVTVKCRIGVDDHDSYEQLAGFVSAVSSAGARRVIVHARKAWLKGLSPKENREVPPLRYDVVARLASDFPTLPLVLNGGIQDLYQVEEHLRTFSGVMMGRAVYHNPYLLSSADARIYGDNQSVPSRGAVLAEYVDYARTMMDRGARLPALSRHVLGLFHDVPGGRRWRRWVGEQATRRGSTAEVLMGALPAD